MTRLLAWLLGTEAPENASLHSLGLDLRGSLPWGAALVVFLVLLAGVIFLYAREAERVSVFRRAVLALLRASLLALLLFLLLRPVLLVEFQGERPHGVVLLLDNSLSMTQRGPRVAPADRLRTAIVSDQVPATTAVTQTELVDRLPADPKGDPSRAEVVLRALSSRPLDLTGGLGRHGPLRIMTFGQRLRRVDGVMMLPADEPKTALADGLLELLQRGDADLPSAIVVMTDGRDNASRATLDDAARECARLKVPLLIYGVGTTESGNLRLKDVVVPETLFYDDTVSATVRWSARGLKQGSAVISLALNGKVVAEREVAVREGDDLRDVLTFTPRKSVDSGEKGELTASIRYKGSEAVTEDNEARRPVRVIDRKVRVLVVENTARWEFKFLMPALLRDRRVDPRFVLLNGDPELVQAGPPFLPAFPLTRPELFAYDLVILGDVPAGALGTEKLTWLRDFVSEGGGLVQIAGRQHAPASLADTPLAEVLPVEVLSVPYRVDPDARPQAFQPVLTKAGLRSELMALADTPEETARTWQELPGFFWHYPVAKLRPGATALLTHPDQKTGDEKRAVLAIQSYGKGQVLFLGADETWRWRSHDDGKPFGRFWGQVIYQMGLPHLIGTPKRVQLALERTENHVGRPAQLYARLFDSEFRPLRLDRVPARLETLDPRPGEDRFRAVQLEGVAGQPGEYRLLLANDAPGRFALRLDAPESAGIDYRVDLPPGHEMEVAGLAEDELRETARLGGGQFYREEDLHHLVADVVPRKTTFTRTQDVLLWNWLSLSAVLALATAEWVVRKFSNLS